jgi:hypothetical protein
MFVYHLPNLKQAALFLPHVLVSDDPRQATVITFPNTKRVVIRNGQVLFTVR